MTVSIHVNVIIYTVLVQGFIDMALTNDLCKQHCKTQLTTKFDHYAVFFKLKNYVTCLFYTVGMEPQNTLYKFNPSPHNPDF